MTQQEEFEAADVQRVMQLVEALNADEGKNGGEKVKEVYEYAVNMGLSSRQARVIVENDLKVTRYQITKYIPAEAKKRRYRARGRFFPQRNENR